MEEQLGVTMILPLQVIVCGLLSLLLALLLSNNLWWMDWRDTSLHWKEHKSFTDVLLPAGSDVAAVLDALFSRGRRKRCRLILMHVKRRKGLR
jgi:hypothetical protein